MIYPFSMSLEQLTLRPLQCSTHRKDRLWLDLRPDFFICLALLAIVLLWPLLFPQSGDGDAIMHYLNARDGLWQPYKLMGSWARVGSKIHLLLPAQMGLLAAHWTCAIVSILCAWQTIELARDLRLPRAPLAAIFLIFQPFVFSLAADTMTEMPFALGTVIATRLWLKDRLIASTLVMGYLPTVRPEGFFLCALWGMMLITKSGSTPARSPGLPLETERRAAFLVPLLAWGTLAWMLAASATSWHDPLYPFRAGWAWPADSLRIYGHGSFFSYLNRWPLYCGPALLILFLAGLIAPARRRQAVFIAAAVLVVAELISPPHFRENVLPWPGLAVAAAAAWQFRRENFALPLWIFLLIFFLHSVLWWQGWFGSCGLMRILAIASPFTALVCLAGWNVIAPRLTTAAKAMALLIVAGSAVAGYVIEPTHFRIFPLQQTCSFASQKHLLENAPMIVFGDPMAQAALNMPPNPPNLMHNICNAAQESAELKKMPLGTLALWDNQHAEQWFGVSLADFPRLGYKKLFEIRRKPRLSIEWLEPADLPKTQVYAVFMRAAAR